MPRDAQALQLRQRPLGRYRYVRLRWRVLFTGIDFAGGLVFAGGRRLWAALSSLSLNPFSKQPGPDETRVILLVQLDHMGDAVITSPMLPALRARYPQASIEVLAGTWNRELFEAMPEVDHVHVSRVNRFSRTGRFGWMLATLWWGFWLRRRRVDLAIDVRGEFPLALILWLCGARRRIGWNAGGGGFLLTHSPRYVPGRPEIESRWALLRELGIETTGHQRPPKPQFRPTDVARERIVRRLAAAAAEQQDWRRPIVLHVGAGSEAKRWPIQHWRELAGRLTVEEGRQVVLVGGPGDRAVARRIMGSGPWPGLFDWTGRLGIVELAALAQRAELLVGADSGPAHLAAAVGTPVVVLFSGTNRSRQWQPRGRSVRVLRHRVACQPCHRSRCGLADHPCMRGIGPQTVLAAVRRQLRLGPRRAAAETESVPNPEPNTVQ